MKRREERKRKENKGGNGKRNATCFSYTEELGSKKRRKRGKLFGKTKTRGRDKPGAR